MGLNKKSHLRKIDGLLLIDKPKGLSSAQVVAKVKGIFKAQKAGHTGSLDPLASGLLPIILGQATKFSSFFLEGAKTYEAEGRLGITTISQDAEGEIVREVDPHDAYLKLPSVLQEFRGDLIQTPSVYSAIKVNGKPLYKYARSNREVEVPSRNISIMELTLIYSDRNTFKIRVHCSKGTYIRTLVHDIGQRLNVGAHVISLRRIGIDALTGPMYTLDELQKIKDAGDDDAFSKLDAHIISTDSALGYLPSIHLSKEESIMLCQGLSLKIALEPVLPFLEKDRTQIFRLYYETLFLGLGHFNDQNFLCCVRMMSDPMQTNPNSHS